MRNYLVSVQAVQRTIVGSCPGEQKMVGVKSDGTPDCTDEHVDYTVSLRQHRPSLLSLLPPPPADPDIHVATLALGVLCYSQDVQRTISGSCENNQKMIGVNSNGSPNCVDEFIDFTVGHGGSE